MKIWELTDNIIEEIDKIMVGKDEEIRLILMAVFAKGHILLDDVPGVGKTTLVKALSIALGCRSDRIQFVPDLLPGDILGLQVFNQKTGDFEIRKGPIFTNVLLADEINRAIPRTQSALLEAMEERQITLDRDRIVLNEPFVVVATQNPVEQESTFSLPVAQIDRFLIKISLGYPSMKEEALMLQRVGDEIPFDSVQSVADAQVICEVQEEVSRIFVSNAVVSYIVALAEATRHHPDLKLGISPRGTRSMYRAAKTWAAMEGRAYVLPDDVKKLIIPVWHHRVIPRAYGVRSTAVADDILLTIMEEVPVPEGNNYEAGE